MEIRSGTAFPMTKRQKKGWGNNNLERKLWGGKGRKRAEPALSTKREGSGGTCGRIDPNSWTHDKGLGPGGREGRRLKGKGKGERDGWREIRKNGKGSSDLAGGENAEIGDHTEKKIRQRVLNNWKLTCFPGRGESGKKWFFGKPQEKKRGIESGGEY